jgi:cytidylate kinase
MRRLLAMGKSREEAEDLLQTVDKERIAFVKHYFNADWPSRSLYHLMINTSIGDEQVIATILDTMRALESRTSEHQMSGIR